MAEGMELVLTDGKVLEELAKTDKSLWEKIRDWFFDIIGQIRRSWQDLNQASKTAQVLKETVESLEEIERLFTEGVREAGERTRTTGVETEGKTDEKKKFSHISIDGKYYTPTDEEIVKNHPTIEPVQIEEAKYYTGITLTDEEYKKYKSDQTKEARKKFGVYTNKDTAYSSQYGEIRAEFGTQCVRKGRFYGGIAYFDILPHIPQIFENAIVVDTKEDKNNDSNIKGIVDLVGCAYLGEDYIAIVKMNVKEYANNDAKLYDNRVVTIEELTVVGRDGHLIEETKRGSTSPTVSSKYILSQYRDFVNRKYSISDYSLIEKYPNLNLNQDVSDMDGVPAIQLEDGSVLTFTEPHVTFIQNNGIDVEDIRSGGWIVDGVYEPSERSDTLRYKERMLAKKRMDEKRVAKKGDIRYSIDEDTENADVSDSAATDRDLLLAMAEQLVGSEEENRILTNYKTHYDTQKARQARLDELAAEMREQQSIMMYDQSAEKRSAAAKRLPAIYKEMSKISEQLADADRKLTEIEGRADNESHNKRTPRIRGVLSFIQIRSL